MSAEAVASTNDDASLCKYYAVSKGYWLDPYIQYFIKSMPDRKTPEINRGYYIRHKTIRTITEKFLTRTKCDCQIINLGAGFDTLYWNLLKKNLFPQMGFYEIDMAEVIRKKKTMIQTKAPLNMHMCAMSVKETDLTFETDFYHLMTADLKNIASVKIALQRAGISYTVPTLVLAECVFAYIDKKEISALLNYFTDEFKTVMLIDYDPINLTDRFGQIMKQNLLQRNCALLGDYPNLQSKKDSYRMFCNYNARLLSDCYKELSLTEKARIERLEFLDEIELLDDLLKHYCISWSYNDPGGCLKGVGL